MEKGDFKKQITNDIVKLENSIEAIQNTTDDILQELSKCIGKMDFQIKAFPESDEIQKKYKALESILLQSGELSENQQTEFEKLAKKLKTFKLTKNHFIIICIEQLIKIAKANKWGLCKKNGFIYLFTGCYWVEIDKERFQFFLGNVALQMGVEKFQGEIYTFKDELFKQFMAVAYLPTPKGKLNCILINFLNGTLEITPKGRVFREFRQEDFITYQLPFEYDPEATAPLFQKFLNEVLPDKDKQKVLAEYCGYIFIKQGVLKLEKMLLLFGTGANGKSVCFEIITAVYGRENVSNFSLQNLTEEKGFYRAKIANKLVNYASEINGKLEPSILKAIISGESVEACLKYGQPFSMEDYAKLISNCNELPKDVEHTNAYFRRLLIINFDVTIPEDKQDKQLSQKIIQNELPGVFNWMLQGLDRVLEQQNFSKCKAIDNALKDYVMQSDTVLRFIDENNYKKSLTEYTPISELYSKYKTFCFEDGNPSVSKSNFIKRLKHHNVETKRTASGYVAYLSCDSSI